MVAKAPSQTQIEASENYALQRLCTLIPSQYDTGLTVWDPQTSTCKFTPKGCTPGPTNPLSQWPTSSSGMQLEFSSKDKHFGNIWQYAKPDMYIMKATSNSNGRTICSRGNSLIYQWCNYPQTRGGGEQMAGLTNVPPFSYNIVRGEETCTIPKLYCLEHGYDYDNVKMECFKPVSLQIAEFFGLGAFVQYMESLGYAKPLTLSDDTLAAIASDSRLKHNIKIHTRDYVGPGIHLYTFIWKPWALEIYGKYGPDIGFIADTLPPSWVITDGHGYKNINLNIQTPGMKKIQDFYKRKR